MNIKGLNILLSLIFLAGIITGCSKAPQEQIDSAKSALEAAKEAEADRYVPEQYTAVKNQLDSALTEIESQNSKFALFRSYSKSSEQLANMITTIEQTRQAASLKKEELKTEAQVLMQQVNTAMEETKKLMAKAPRGKEGKAALQAIQNDLLVVETSMAEANTALQNGDYLGARDKFQANLEKVTALNQEMMDAISKKTANMRK